jgi:cobalt/nickel transport system permease protein
MFSIHSAILDLKRLDLLANGDSGIHRLDARAKVLVTLVFIVSVVSFDKYDFAPLIPFFIFPAFMIARAGLPLLYIVRKTIIICPFVLAVGIFNPVFDREILVQLGSLSISGGWISFASILVRTALTVGAAFILIAVSGFTGVCQALEQLGMPRLFAVQLNLLYRYIFVLTEEASRVSRARELRSFGRGGLGIKSYASLTGSLLLRTWELAERLHMAMLARGFTGEFHARRSTRFGGWELLFLLGWSALFLVLRKWDISKQIGAFITGALS